MTTMLGLSVKRAWLVACVLCTSCNPGSLDGFDLKRPTTDDDPRREAGAGGVSGNDASLDSGPVAPPGSGGAVPGSGGDLARDSGGGIILDSGSIRDAQVGECPEPTTALVDAGESIVLDSHDLGVQARPSTIAFRDGGGSSLVDGKSMWLYHDTRFRSPASDGAMQRACTAAIGGLTPTTVSEPLDAARTPGPLLTLLPGEETPIDGGTARGLLWPNTAVYDGKHALIFYLKVTYLGYLAFDIQGVGVGRAAPGGTTATRDPGLLFNCDKGDPAFHAGGIVDDEGYLYLYGCSRKLEQNFPCHVARSPRGQWATRAGYRFWNSATKSWSTAIKDASPIFGGVPSEMSVSYNRYLGRYIAVYTGGPNQPVMRTAPRPEGPWSDEILLFNGVPPSAGLNYGAKEHPEYSSECGKKIIVTYPRNVSTAENEIRVVEVTFR